MLRFESVNALKLTEIARAKEAFGTERRSTKRLRKYLREKAMYQTHGL